MSELEKYILRTVVYYDVLDMAPTTYEIWRNLLNARNNEQIFLGSIIVSLDDLATQKIIEQKWGFNFLPGRENLCVERLDKLNLTDEKWKKARRAFSMLALVPYLRMVFASGSFALGNTERASDIDILVVLKRERIWTGRLIITILLHILGMRRHGTKISNRICLNHFITDASLQIPFRSLYNAHIYANLVPIMTVHGAEAEGFFKANKWINDFVGVNDRLPPSSRRTIKPNKILLKIASVSEVLLNTPIGGWLEGLLKNIQQRRISSNPVTHNNIGHVLANDDMLAFHPDSPEHEIINKFNKKLVELGLG
ncbi:MAG: hypothetical protein A3A80_03575 [Candidatus Terrybacteria bacterium RIFCSPLOWO2_01_FULL_44_24]|uniref:Polymerase nucleotidyl transferase domain-containing protein n=1 Tax=Candidatus Terrybacteria bacterium RIFCSPHIGHO2_01_FULL_43_35 TaxID=1802361 RepID=A0A1G2PFK3_9BACT|nr:MAG: hypothetical protein A2828_00495 [Candidatus Terrybacteria bacterium RIFCSPHIGHO2_01_FULL_43_35]OHA49762.1 MAG: hypothetical protein A3B75_02070 [Candidatus Terrybacteria bacterium RIFCSPHIGHO2_02_FULL_43_14]OHA51584.1 MAG: hypothetical protein A3A80_03575 [Candidatus Terrybacteria bacterium RIFCSPLOWO2_01_FULL_44_24]